MRWDEQLVERDLRLPGVGDASVVRTFDAPEAMGINFHEVRARSALNRVPGGRFGFDWTVNPYRGCTHACQFCMAGETSILMANGATKHLADLKVFDAIYGTVCRGSERRFELSWVIAHWRTHKPAYRVSLEDGTELIASGDHRFFTDHGWKYVLGTGLNRLPRPHLTPGDRLAGGPAISPKRSRVGIAIKPQAELGVVSIEPLGRRIPMFDITTATGDFIANGVLSHNCFARRTHTYLGFDAGRDFEREIVVKVNVPELLRAELARPSWKQALVALGTNTDPYQWVESRYRMMPEIIAALEAADTPVTVLTKSPLVMRDIDLYEQMSRRLSVSVNLSVPTLDEETWRATEPHTPSPNARLAAVAELRRRGIDSGVLIAPLMPGINDTPEQVQRIADRAREAGASFLGGVALHLRDEVRDVFFAWLQAKRPDLLPRYERLYADDRAYLGQPERNRVTSVVRGWGKGRARSFPGGNGEGGSRTSAGSLAKAREPDGQDRQARLF